MSILKDKKGPVVFALAIMIVGTIAYFGTDAYLMGYDEEHFIREMIIHHEEAVDSSRMMLNSENPLINGLASDIVELQQQEIMMLESWLDEWYPEAMSEEKPMKYMGTMPELSDVPSNDRDVAYIRGMIMHHEEAIMMAEKVLKTDARTEVKELAQEIISVQSAEISSMRKILDGLNGVLI